MGLWQGLGSPAGYLRWGEWGWLTPQLLQDCVHISHALGKDWGDACFLGIQKRPCRAPSPSPTVPVPIGLKMLRPKAFLWPGGGGGGGVPRQAGGGTEGGFPPLAAPCKAEH